ncbi:DUF3306 domain-containing protein [Rhabdaerophilum sp. SD176]|uniref:DUF3306 domain-containing protein n=1 Tax=Rhabdaerophilum sp. SD176 TaxID=2983548 RepID=UPI0024DF55C5|nr:DUF3306 domain-containing protein [Rhabdaerophilum sp. SD176]
MSQGEGFLSRWSRRKLKPEPEAGASVPDDPSSVPAAVEGEPMLSAEAEPEFDVSTLTPLEALTSESDFTQFLQKGVPEALRNAALRKMWVLDPVLSAPDRFAEYAWDFNDPTAMPGFGPMEAGFDPASMLRRIMGEKDPEVPVEDGAAGLPADIPAANQDEARLESPEPVPLADSPAAGQIVAIPEDSGEYSMVAKETVDETPETIAPRRRHGGALPN